MAATSLMLARAVGRLSRRLGQGGGTSLPGKLLLGLRPAAIGDLAAVLSRGAITVSATNGKTTACRMIAACAREAGWPLVTNAAGANLLSGIATALLDGTTARPSAELGVFEVDEAALPAASAELRPRAVVLMNLFRDQLDRHGELEELAARWRRMVLELPAETTVVVNADDPALAELAEGRPGTVFFGVSDPGPALAALPHAADSIRCRRCGARLEYERVYIGHLGHWRCPACGAHRPEPAVRATRVALDGPRGLELEVATPAGPLAARIPLPGLHNAYNATAAVAGALAVGVPLSAISPALARSQAAFGRAERVRVDGHDAVMLLVKNPVGANETVRTLLLDPEPLHLLIALNDRTADGHDVSWIWDVDYEPLLPRLAGLTLTGDRAHDLGLRFRYAGLPSDRMRIEPDAAEALEGALAALPPGRPLYLLPTYTAMLRLRDMIVRRGGAEAFWRDG